MLGLLASAGLAFAQGAADLKAMRDRQDQRWADKSGLTVSEVRAIRILAGITDAIDGAAVQLIDAKSLRQRNHILLAEAGNGHCMRVHVFERTGSIFQEVWSLTGLPPRDWPIGAEAKPSGPGICPQGPRPPNVQATPEGRIIVEVPVLFDPFQRSMPANTFSFEWDGSKYVLVEDR